MKLRYALPLLLIAAAGCEADEETFEEGATMEAPAAVEQAPATPMPLPPSAPSAGDTLQQVEIDTTGS